MSDYATNNLATLDKTYNPDQYLDRKGAAAYFASKNIPITYRWLSKHVKDGPPFRLFAGKARYSINDLNAWISQKNAK